MTHLPPHGEASAPVGRTVPSALLGHLQIARVDHWVKNLFVLPGAVAALALNPAAELSGAWISLLLALLSTGLVASSNYTLNEVLDADYDRRHPTKRHRAVAAGRVRVPLAMLQWLLLGAAGFLVGMLVGPAFTACMVALWFMGCVYNVRPIRTKDVPYLDVVSEALNNPIRLLAGWFAISAAYLPPLSLLLSYWMVGCYFMATKRLAEVRNINDREAVAAYRPSLAAVGERSLLISTTFYGSIGMLFFGAFLMRYRIEMILSFPLVALVMAVYLNMAFEEDSPAQYPERLYRHPAFLTTVTACALAMTLLFFIDVPILHHTFAPGIPEAAQIPP